MKLLRIIGILIGLTIVGYLVHQVGWGVIRHTLGLLEWGYVIVLCYPLSWMVFNTTGWFWALHVQYASRLSLLRLLPIRLAGETFNSLLPSGYVGGEPLKAKLLGGIIPLREATSSVLIAKSAQSIGLVVFVGLGLTLGQNQSSSSIPQRGTWTALAILAGGIAIFSVLLARRSFSRLGRGLYRITRLGWIQRREKYLVSLDESLGNFYREGKGRFFMSIVFHLMGWLAGALEVAVIFWLIDHPIGWRQAWFIGAMAQLASVIGLLVPAGVGLYEGGHYMAASLLGINPALGLSVSLVRRVREIFWDVLGLLFFWKLS
ncbi:MAG: lysylphosphatidylglycerol synthase domain-containing protein [Elusimicrobiota bacterium]|jgi:uncharacterized protein (TIRG00374 family)